MKQGQRVFRGCFGRGDLEAFFGLFGDVFSKISAMIGILYYTEGFPAEIVMGRILPGIAMGSILGCIIYFYEAYILNRKEGRRDVTALPFGLGAGQVFAWMLLILVPIYRQTNDAEMAWQIALASCFIGGFIEILGAFVSRVMAAYIPNSALLGNMAASALIWLAFHAFITVFQVPLIGVIPLFAILLVFRMKKPFFKKIPNSLLVLLIGTGLAWITGFTGVTEVKEATQFLGFYPPSIYLKDIMQGIGKIGPYLSIIIPLQIANFINTMQSVESAAIAGDRYPVKSCMVWDGISTVISALFGSPFPTTVYCGHPGWKKVGARSGYPLLMAAAYVMCLFGVPLVILALIPYEVIVVLLVFVGITVTVETIDTMQKEYSAIILISVFPMLAQYFSSFIDDVLTVAGSSVNAIGIAAFNEASVMVQAMRNLSNGAFASSLFYAAWIAYVYDRNYKYAGFTAVGLALSSAIGFIHSPQLAWLPPGAATFTFAYLMIALLCWFAHWRNRKEV